MISTQQLGFSDHQVACWAVRWDSQITLQIALLHQITSFIIDEVICKNKQKSRANTAYHAVEPTQTTAGEIPSPQQPYIQDLR